MSTDYLAENLKLPNLDSLFPDMIVGDKEALTWPYFRRGVDHNWYADRRDPQVGFINKDEASILYSNAPLVLGSARPRDRRLEGVVDVPPRRRRARFAACRRAEASRRGVAARIPRRD